MPDKTDHDLLIEISTKLDVALGTIKDHEDRMRKVEFKVWTFSGVAALFGSGAGAAVVHALHL